MTQIKTSLCIFIFFIGFLAPSQLSAQNTNRYDKNNKRIGLWKKYYANNRIRYEGNFKDGKEIGVFKYYDITSSRYPIIIKDFSTSTDSASVQYFTLQGKLRSKGKMLGRNRVGAWLYYFPTGELFSEEYYVNGALEGDLKNYYKNGVVTEHSQYKNGLKNGFSRKYSDTGVLIEELHYQHGKENGMAKFFELNGDLKEKGMYKNGNRFGKWEYYMDGEIASEEAKKKAKKGYKKNK